MLTIEASPTLTFISVIVPDIKGISHLLVADKLIKLTSAVPEFESKASALKFETAVVVGANQTGA
ncbi:hypothetical protein D3C86_1718960 [compost metagenome]